MRCPLRHFSFSRFLSACKLNQLIIIRESSMSSAINARAKNLILGALVADAAAMGTHFGATGMTCIVFATINENALLKDLF